MEATLEATQAPAAMQVDEVQNPEKAQAIVKQMDTLAEEWTLKLHDAEQALAAVEASAGESVLASLVIGGDGTSEAVAELANARASYDIAKKTLQTLERHQVIAGANLRLAKAYQLRVQVADKQTEFETHMAKVKTLLGKLEALEGAPYVPHKPPPQVAGLWRDPEPYFVPKSEVMQRECAALLREATQLEASAQTMLAKAKAPPPAPPGRVAESVMPAGDGRLLQDGKEAGKARGRGHGEMVVIAPYGHRLRRDQDLVLETQSERFTLTVWRSSYADRDESKRPRRPAYTEIIIQFAAATKVANWRPSLLAHGVP